MNLAERIGVGHVRVVVRAAAGEQIDCRSSPRKACVVHDGVVWQWIFRKHRWVIDSASRIVGFPAKDIVNPSLVDCRSIVP